jgi:hypothetical protein
MCLPILSVSYVQGRYVRSMRPRREVVSRVVGCPPRLAASEPVLMVGIIGLWRFCAFTFLFSMAHSI